MYKVLVINGPNLNRLGKREPEIYGALTLEQLNNNLRVLGESLGVHIDYFQSNIEGEIINEIHRADNQYDGVLINPAAYTHYSYAIADAIKSIPLPFVEVHLSNIYVREEFRSHSVTASSCIGAITGFGDFSYSAGLYALVDHLKKKV
jgi:3-dehydroquinate dehydratase-2